MIIILMIRSGIEWLVLKFNRYNVKIVNTSKSQPISALNAKLNSQNTFVKSADYTTVIT